MSRHRCEEEGNSTTLYPKKLYGYNVVDLLIKPIALICLIWNLVTSPPGVPSPQRDYHRLRVVPHFSPGIPHARKGETCRLFSYGIIFTRARVSLALLSLRTNGGLLVVYVDTTYYDLLFTLTSNNFLPSQLPTIT